MLTRTTKNGLSRNPRPSRTLVVLKPPITAASTTGSPGRHLDLTAAVAMT
jgi:hypothetical protein